MPDPQRTVVYTDGACSGNPGPGGWAWAESPERFGSGGAAATTNNRMELQAVIEALADNVDPLRVVMDSTYVKSGLEQWSRGWEANGWRTKAGQDVKNRDLWEPLVAEFRGRDVELGWVKGHSGDPMNDLVDALAVEQRDAHRGSTDSTGSSGGSTAGGPGGGTKLADLPPDEQRAERRRRDGRIPTGHLLGVFGHAPPELGGWDTANPIAADVRRRLRELIEAKQLVEPDLAVVTGLRLGAEQLAAEAAIRADVPYVAVLPYPDADAAWPPETRTRFADLVGRAREAVTLEKKRPADRAESIKALGRRDSWLANALDEAVLVWDGDDRRLAPLHRTLERRFGPDLWVLRP